jgi:Amt family ammonium transporter
MVETWFCRAKNARTDGKEHDGLCRRDPWLLCGGFVFLKGADAGGLIGVGPFSWGRQYDVGGTLISSGQLVFCATAATIVSGAVARAEVLRYFSSTVLSSACSFYHRYGHWVLGGGWLSKRPRSRHLVFAGSGVVHTIGGMFGSRGRSPGAEIRHVYERGEAERYPGPLHHSGGPSGLHTLVRLVRVQQGSTFKRHHLRISVIAVNTCSRSVAALRHCSSFS